MNLRFLASCALVAAVAAVAVGCGASADLSSVAKAANKTEDVKTTAFTLTLAVSGEPEFVGEGATDLAAHNGRIILRQSDKLVYEAIWNGATVYLRSPDLPGAPADGKPWIKLSGSDGFGDFSQFPLLDPARQFALLRDAGHFEEAGNEDVRGVSTTRYEGTVNLKKFVEEFGPVSSEDELPDDLSTTTFPVQAWIDGDGYLRRVALGLPSLGSDEPAGRMRIELYDFGAPVDATPPPADQVGEFNLPSYTATQHTLNTYLPEPMTTGG
jgi:hypothetical protein